ncbi:MAG: hypothetical protein ABEI86_06880 [Halobacteriaceae archaeon]
MNGVAPGISLVFFLFLLIPGYAAVRSYLWANIALDDTTRLTKLVLMSFGGFASLALVSFFREIELFALSTQQNSGLISAFTFDKPLTLTTVSSLSILESTALILAQSMIAIFGGVLVGALRIVVIDGEQVDRQQIIQPWEELSNQVRTGDELTVVTHGGEKVTGKLKQIGNPPREHDLILTNPERTYIDSYNHSTSPRTDSIGELSYHHEQDISRVIAYREWTESERGMVSEWYLRLLQKGLNVRKMVVNALPSVRALLSWRPIKSEEADDGEESLELSSEFRIEYREAGGETSIKIEPIKEGENEGEDP